ncbi:MAG TPA: glycosyltransferase family 4 protein [Streptomyces sp.]|uniref:glycosyltransferase family 4 protein n=1 Tax=Streptomyces sp. TaxID=1931 RepID=UPI002C4C0C9C|nr:glycosyltransferase family 4 protein [Streptomyces sp.]HWU05209.1 glycosyltransferase family 4 protein [Streptomyces sp.]
MRILSVVTLGSASGRFGGPFETAVHQAQILASQGHSVRLMFGTERGDEPVVEPAPSLTAVPVPVRPLTRRWPFSSLFSRGLLSQAWRRAGAADVVHVAMARDLVPVVAAIAALLRRRRLVLQPHGMLTTTSSGAGPADAPVGLLLRSAHRLIALTDREAHELVIRYRVDADRVTVLGNPVDPQAALQERTPGHRLEALFVARLHPRKRPEDFVAAARTAHDAGWAERYVLLGPDGGMLDRLRPDIEATANLEYAGSVPGTAVAARVARTGVFVLCSDAEPWGNVLVAALAMGVPCIVTASSALADRLAAAGAAVVVPDRDAAALAAAVHDVLGSAGLRDDLARGGRRFVADHLSPSRQAETLLAAYTR